MNRIAIHDSDGVGFKFPNYALMKISAYHKFIGDKVEWFNAITNTDDPYDKIYSAKVFTFTDEDHFLPKNAICGGTGYNSYENLPSEIESMFPDYSIYPHTDYAIGFLTRGCPNKCPWCVVPKKEGAIKPYMSWGEIKRKDSNIIIFMDNNVLASEWGLSNIQEMANQKIKVDFNQGLDARLINQEVAKMLSKLKWYNPIRMACDSKKQMPYIEQAVSYLREEKATPKNYSCYVLVKDIEDALERVEFLRKLNVDPFAQPYRDFENKLEPTQEQKDFARWVNHKAIFRTVKWSEYKHENISNLSSTKLQL